ncbi:MAG: integrase family protein [Proteobacteria bacterium]|nr:integrase family protein [Pseudomonadota bacterium]
MARIRLSESKIQNIRAPNPDGKQVIIWDDQLRGFGVLVSGKTNSKSFVVQRDVGERARRITIGRVGELTLDEARDDAIAKIKEMRKGIVPKSEREMRGDMTLQQALDSYLKTRHNKLRPKSAKDYRSCIERHLEDWLDYPLRGITSDDVERRHREIQEKAQKNKKKGATKGEAMANGVIRTLRILWNFANRRIDDLPPNPTRRLGEEKAWYKIPPRKRLVKNTELPRFYKAVNGLKNKMQRDYLKLLLFTGMRRGEAAGLKWAEVDLDEKVIAIPDHRTKSGKELNIPMSSVVHDLLKARLKVGRDKKGFVFPSHGKSGHLEEPKSSLRIVAKKTGIEISPHDLRRTFITTAESCDISYLALKMLVGHSLEGDVTAGYVIPTPERLRELNQKVTDRLVELTKTPRRKLISDIAATE